MPSGVTSFMPTPPGTRMTSGLGAAQRGSNRGDAVLGVCCHLQAHQGGQILPHSRRNRGVSCRPFLSYKPRGDRYADYCRNSLVKFRLRSGGLHNGWGGPDGELADTDDPVRREHMVETWLEFAQEIQGLPRHQQPRGWSARDLQTPRRRRRQQGGNDGDGDASSSSSEGETDDESDDSLDGIHGDGGRLPDELDARRG